LARIYFESGQYDLSLSALQNLALRIEDVQAGYGLVLLVQARAIKGICLEQAQNDEGAIEAYEAAWNAVELQPQERGVMLSFWIEECLYRGILLRLKLK
jgi:tetratricopeptide (TPR) repeat protein